MSPSGNLKSYRFRVDGETHTFYAVSEHDAVIYAKTWAKQHGCKDEPVLGEVIEYIDPIISHQDTT